MPDLHHLLLFIAAGLLLNLTPGPDVMFIVASAVRGGLRVGVAAALGIGAGCLVHVAAAALGVSALLLASGTALAALKWLGALYLVWMGAQMLRAALCPVASKKIAAGAELAPAAASFDAEPPEGAQRLDASAVLRRGFLTNALNPKVALFFLAFVPQFIAPGTAHPGAVFLALGLVFTINGVLVCLAWAWLAAWAARRAGVLRRAMRWLDGAAGALFVALGVKLALTDLPARP